MHQSSKSGGPEIIVAGKILHDRYRLEVPVARGGFGVVWQAEHILLRKRVAVKILRTRCTMGPDDGARARMVREARTLSKVQHPNVVEVLDFGYVDRSPFIIMEFLEGHSLQEELKLGPMTWERAQPVILQIIAGLAVAHDAGIVHRDVKPSNIFLVNGGVAKIIDFGTVGASDSMTRITQAGEILGTPIFMSPELTRGLNVTIHSDIYSLGCVLFAMLAGRPPFTGKFSEAIRQHLYTPAPLLRSAVADAVPHYVCEAVARCLAKAPAERFESMHALHTALSGEAVGQSPAPLSESARRVRRVGGVLAAVASAALVGMTMAWVSAHPGIARTLASRPQLWPYRSPLVAHRSDISSASVVAPTVVGVQAELPEQTVPEDAPVVSTPALPDSKLQGVEQAGAKADPPAKREPKVPKSRRRNNAPAESGQTATRDTEVPGPVQQATTKAVDEEAAKRKIGKVHDLKNPFEWLDRSP